MKNGFRAKELQTNIKFLSRFLLTFTNSYGMKCNKQILFLDKVDNRIKYNIKSDFENFIKKGSKW